MAARAPAEEALAALAHDVRTPLTGILALAELLSTSGLPERERAWVMAVKGAAEHLAQLTTLIVDGAKARTGRLVPTHHRFAPRGLAEGVAASLSGRAGAEGLEAEIVIADDLPELVCGEPVRLRAALENLIDNAVKFTERGRVGLDVRAQPAGRGRTRLVFTVTDSGIGLTPPEIKRLFRPFAQASDQVARRFGGAGLGLVFVKRLAKAMDGDIAVESAPGRGSIFRLSVVVANADPGEIGAGGGARTDRPARSLNVLCAEDNPYGRVILNTILTELGQRVDFVGTGEAAVEAVRNGGHDIVLMDITLPGIDGIEATRRIRALPGAVGRIPVIGITGRAEPCDEDAARAAGMDGYLIKPMSPSALAEAIGSLTSR